VNLSTGHTDRVSAANFGAEQAAIETGGATAVLASREFGGGALLRVVLNDGSASVIVSAAGTQGPSGAVGVAIAPGRATALVTDDRNQVLWRVNLSNGDVTTIASGFSGLIGVVIEPSGETALVTQGGSSGGIYRVNLAAGQVTLVAQDTQLFQDPRG
jgi:hypothetical protein